MFNGTMKLLPLGQFVYTSGSHTNTFFIFNKILLLFCFVLQILLSFYQINYYVTNNWHGR